MRKQGFWFTCPECGKDFLTEDKLKLHDFKIQEKQRECSRFVAFMYMSYQMNAGLRIKIYKFKHSCQVNWSVSN